MAERHHRGHEQARPAISPKDVDFGWQVLAESLVFDLTCLVLYVGKEGSFTIVRTPSASVVLRYEEEPAAFSWQLLSDTGTVMGYVCQKARTGFKGRVYEAWYCPVLPVDAGPYKFGGLPGLILKVADTAGDYSWEATGIEEGAWSIYEKKFIARKCTRAQARKTIADMFSNPFYFGDYIRQYPK